jgi:hypothetical protein
MTLMQATASPVRPASRPDGTSGEAGGRRARHARPAPAAPGRRPVLAGIIVAGAHGGSGTSVLAQLLRLETQAAWPDGRIPVRELPAIPDADPRQIAATAVLPGRVGGPLILTARGTADGARRAVTAVAVLAGLGLRPAALAVVDDGAGPLPRLAAERLDLLGDRAGPVVVIPFAAALRAGAAPETARLPGRLRRAVAGLAELAIPLAAEGWS